MAKKVRNMTVPFTQKKIYTVISREWALLEKFNTFRSNLK